MSLFNGISYDSVDATNVQNILLIDTLINDYEVLKNSCNTNTLPILYSRNCNTNDLRNLLKTKFSKIKRLSLAFNYERLYTFLNNKPLFNYSNPSVSDENVQFLLDIIKEFHIEHVDFLACNTFQDQQWRVYYELLRDNTNVVVGASNNKTGNLLNGGDWVLETTSENIEAIYFSESISYYQYLLDVAGGTGMFYVSSDGKVYGTGDVRDGGLGFNPLNNNDRSRCVFGPMSNLPSDKVPVQIASAKQTIFLMNDGTIYGGGTNIDKELGQGGPANIDYPRMVPFRQLDVPSGKLVSQVSTGNTASFLLMTDGTLYAAGRNTSGQLGLGNSVTSAPVWTQVTNLSGKTPSQISAGGFATFLVMTDGTLYATGEGGFGQTSFGKFSPTLYNFTQVTLPAGKTVKKAGQAGYNALILMTDGTLYGTGDNYWNNVVVGGGNGSGTGYLRECPLPTGKLVSQFLFGGKHTVILTTDGLLYGVGENTEGQLGLGSSTTRANNWTSISIPDGKTVAQLSGNSNSTVLLMTDGTIYGAGANTSGELGVNIFGDWYGTPTTPIYNFTQAKVDLSSNSVTNPDAITVTNAVLLGHNVLERPTITNFSVPSKNYGDNPFTITDPSSNSYGSFSYTSSNTSVATISGSTITIVGAGTTTITATQSLYGSYNYGIATTTFTVSGSPPTITNFSVPNKTFGDSSFSIIDPSSNSGGSFSYSSSNTSVATISGNTITIVGAGTSTITATQNPLGNYDTGSATTTITVSKLTTTLNATTPVEKSFGDSVFSISFSSNNNETSTFSSSDTSVATIASNGNVTLLKPGSTTITISKAETANASSASTEVVINVSKTYTASQLRSSGFSASQMKNATYSDSELKAGGYTAAQMKAAGNTGAELQALGYTSTEMKAASYTATELIAVGYTGAELYSAGYTGAEMKPAGFTANDLKELGYSAGNLQSAFTVAEMEEAGYTLQEMKDGGFTATQMKTANKTVSELRSLGYTATELNVAAYDAGDMNVAGYTASEMKTAGFTATRLKDAGYAISALYAAGYTATEMKAASYTASELKDVGYTASQLYTAGYTATQMKSASYTASELKAVSYTASQLYTAGYTASEMKDASYTATQLKAAGYTASQLYGAGYTVSEMKTATFTASQLKVGGYAAADMYAAGYTATEMKDASYTATQLKALGYTATQLYTAGYTATEMKDASYTATQLKAVGYTASQMYTAGYTSTEMKAASYTASELKAVNYTVSQLYTAGYTVSEMKAASYTATELKAGGYAASDMYSAGYTATEMRSASYTASETKALGYTATQLYTAGYSATEMRSASYTATELKAEGYTGAQMYAAGYSATEMKVANFSASELVSAGFDGVSIVNAGYTASNLRSASYTISQIKLLGFTDNQVLAAGYSATELRSASYSATQLRQNSYTSSQLRTAGYTVTQIVAGGFSKAEAVAAGFSVSELRLGGLTASEMREQGYTAQQLSVGLYTSAQILAAGYTSSQLVSAGYSVSQLKENNYSDANILSAGFSANALYSAGYTSSQLKANNYTASSLRSAGFLQAEILALGYSASELRDASFTATNLKGSSYTASQLISGGYSKSEVLPLSYTAAELKAATFTASELRAGSYTIAQLQAGGYSDSEILAGGYSATLLKGANYTASQLYSNSYTIQNLKDAGYSANEIIAAGYSSTLLKTNGYTAQQLKNNDFIISDLQTAGYTSAEILSVGYSADDLLLGGYSASQLKANSYAASDLKTAGYTDSQILSSGYTANELKLANYTASQLRANSYSVSDLVTGGYSTNAILSAGYTATQLKAGGYTVSQLKTNGYTVDNLISASYTTSQILSAGYSASNLLPYYTVQQLKTNGYTPLQLKAGGYSDSDILSGSFSASLLRSASYTASNLRSNGYSVSDLVSASYTKSQILSAGFTSSELQSAGYSASDLRQNGYSIQDLKDAGYTDNNILSAGYSASDLYSESYTASQLYNNSYTASQLKAGGFNDQDVISLGYSVSQLRTAGFTPSDLITTYSDSDILSGGFTATSLKDAGYTVSQLKDSNYTVSQIKTAGYNDSDILSSGFTVTELKLNNYTASDLRDNSYTATELRVAGYSVSDLIGGSYTTEQILNADFTANNLRSAGFTSSQLKAASYTALELSDGGYSDEEVLSIGYTVNDLTIAGFTPAEMRTYGYTDSSILEGISSALGTLPNPPVINSVTVSNSSITIEFVDTSNTDVPVIGYKYSLDGGLNLLWTRNTVSPLQIIGLTNGTSYDVGIYAVNRNGTSAISNIFNGVVPSDVPSKPYLLNASSSNGVISAEFILGSNNGSEISNYYYSINDVNYVSIVPSGSTISISDLSLNQTYNLSLKVGNASGLSEKSNTIAIKNYGSMVAPVITDVSFNNKIASVYYTIDSSLSKVFYKYSLNNASYEYFKNQTSPLLLSNLSANDNYSLKIKSEHFNYSESAESNIFNFTTISEPTKPIVLTSNYFNGVISMSIIDSSSNGSEITNYYYSLNDSSYSEIDSIDDSVIVINKIINTGISNVIKIKAKNAIGFSEVSNSSTLTYKILPDKPIITSVSAGDSKCTINFTEGALYGSTLLCYKYRITGDTKTYIAKDIVNPLEILGLSNGTSYTIKIKAVTEAGESDYSNISESFTPTGLPAPPRLLTIEPRIASLLFTFVDGSNGGLDILGYKYSINGGDLIETPTKTSPMTITGLVDKQPFSISLYSYNSAGLSLSSNTLFGTPGVPTAPTITSITTADKKFFVNFTPSALTNGSQVAKMCYTFDGITINQLNATTSPLTIPNVQNGRFYNISILSMSANGYSPLSNTFRNVIINVPPAILAINSVSLFFDTPTSCFAIVNLKTPIIDNGSQIIKYKYALGTSNSYTDVSGTNLPLKITGLPVNVSFTMKLIAVNAYGDSPVSLSTKPVVFKLLPPAKPVIKTVTTSFNNMRVDFLKPLTNGSEITTYKYSLNGGAYVDLSSSVVPFNITIQNNVNYNIQIKATNAVGDSEPSALLAKTVSFIYISPAPPKIISIVGGNQSLTVNFTAALPRGAPVTSYAYSVDNGTTIIDTSANASPMTITGLTNDTTYSVTIYANSLAGRSTASNAFAGKPVYSAPGAPVIKSIRPLNNSCLVDFNPFVVNGSPITDLLYTIDNGTTMVSTGKNTYPLLITGLSNGTLYSLKFKASNILGDSPLSGAMTVTPIYAVPTAPQITRISAGVKRMTILFKTSTENGAAITSYYYSIDNGVTKVNLNSLTSPVVVSNLTSFYSYTVTMYAENEVGFSAASNAITVTIL